MMIWSLRTVSMVIARAVTGGALTLASISKVISFHQFAAALPQLTLVPEALAAILAACVITLEFFSGVLLLLGISVRIAGYVAGLLFAGFVLVLSGVLVRGIDLPCNCFGVFGPVLTLRGQALLDILLAAAAVFVVWNSGESKRTSANSIVAAGASLAALAWGAALIAWPSPKEEGNTGEGNPAPYVHGVHEGSHERPSVLLLADFDDFGCRLCLDDFLALCDSLNGERFHRAASVRLIARRDTSRTASAQARILNGWAAGNGYTFPVSVDTGSVFENSGVGKTSAIILAADGRLIDVAHFPTGGMKRNEILRAIAG